MTALRLIPLDETVVFPGMSITLTVGVGDDERVALVPRHESAFAEVGVIARVSDRVRLPGGGQAVALEAETRALIGAAHTGPDGELYVEVDEHADPTPNDGVTRNAGARVPRRGRGDPRAARRRRPHPRLAARDHRAGRARRLVRLQPRPHLRAAALRCCATLDVPERLELALDLQRERLAELQIRKRIRDDVQEGAEKQQRDYFLRKQMDSIRKELGEDDASVVEEYRTKIEAAEMPEQAHEQAVKELGRLERMGEQSGEASMIRTYLDWMISIPWSKRSDERLDPVAARDVLDADHAGLEDVKDRVTEYLAVRKLRQDRGIEADPQSGAILTLIGPPGTGKTSIGESIARATGREFVRMSLGGVRDEAEIRGHRRTYIGALPGRLVRALRDAGTINPVILLDEVDKIGADWRGDPSSALLEVLDPAQNHSFRDHYLDVELDLSQVLFIATANQADTIPGPLLDRMEVISFDGYTSEEKLAIAKGYLWPRQRDRNGLLDGEVTISDELLGTVDLRVHPRGGRAQPRARARQGAAQDRDADRLGRGDAAGRDRLDVIRDALGRQRFFQESAARTAVPGVATGLAVTGTRRRRAVRRGDRDEEPQLDPEPRPHRPARRRDEGVGADRALLRARARARAGHPRGRVRGARVPHPRAGRRDPEGRAERGRDDGHGADLAADRARRSSTRSG